MTRNICVGTARYSMNRWGEWSHQLQNVKRQDFHYDIIYSDGGPTSGRVKEDIKSKMREGWNGTERVIVPPSAPLSTPPPSYARFPRSFIDNPRVLIRIPIFRFNTMFPRHPQHFPLQVPLPSTLPLSPFPLGLLPFAPSFPSERLNGQTETFKLRAHKANEFCTRGHDSLELYRVVN